MDSREKLADWIYKTYLCGGSLPDTKETAQVGADALIAFLKKNGWVKLDDDQSLPANPYPADVWPMTGEDVGAMLSKHLTDSEKTAVCGAWGRYVYDLALKDVDEAGFRKVE